MSLYAKLAAAVVLILALIAAGWKIHHSIYMSGVNDTEVKYAAKAEADRIMKQEGIDNISSTFVAKAAKQRTIVQSNAEKVAQYAPDTFPPLPGSFRLWHDAAATGKALDDTGGTDAPTVSLKAVASTVAYNYATCLDDQQRLEAVQAILKKINGD